MIEFRALMLAIMFAAMVGLGLGGTIVHAIDKGAYAALELRVSTAEATAKDAAAKRLEADHKAGEAIAARTVADARLAGYQFNELRKENSDVEKAIRGQGVPAHVLPAGWVRQYNAAVSAGAGKAGAPAGGTDAAASGAGADESPAALAEPSGFTEWDVLDNATDNAEGYASCRRQLNRLIDYEEATTE